MCNTTWSSLIHASFMVGMLGFGTVVSGQSTSSTPITAVNTGNLPTPSAPVTLVQPLVHSQSAQHSQQPWHSMTQPANGMTAGVDGSGLGTCQSRNCYGSCYHQFAKTHESDGNCNPGPTWGWRHYWQRDRAYFQSAMEPPCPGHFLNQMIETQKANGRTAQYVFYSFHFDETIGPSELGLTSSGWNKARDMARIWPLTPGVVTIQPSGIAEIDQARFLAAQHALGQLGLPLDPEQFVIANAASPSLTSSESLNIFVQRALGSPLNPIQGGSGNAGGGSGSTNQQQGPSLPGR